MKSEEKLNDFDIMNQILEIRYTDLVEEKKLCLQLLDLAEKKQNDYAKTFAYVYLFDSVLALGEYYLCDNYLSQAIYLSRKNKFQNLLMILCNLAGLYYIRLNDEQTALQYFLDGLDIASDLDDNETSGMIYNNMGLAFAARDDWRTAKELFQKAFQAVSNDNNGTNKQKIISYLSNLAESYLQIGEMEKAHDVLMKCDSLFNNEFYYQIRIGCEWTAYYEKTKQKEKCLEQVQKLLDLHIEDYDNKFFICDMISDISECVLRIEEYDLAKKIIDMLDDLVNEAPPIVRYRVQCAKIHYFESIGQDVSEAYEGYYQIDQEMIESEDKVRLQSILSIIQLHEVLKERDEIQLEKEVLENIIRIDELTGLYNRRYFNKLITKISLNSHNQSIGIIMLDIDYFKDFNDFYGHLKGDETLKTVGKVLKKYAIDGITPCRYGGDEFICLCHNVSSQEVDEYVYNVNRTIKENHIAHEASAKEKYLTLSIGYIYKDKIDKVDIDKLLALADEALYKVKREGRNNYYRLEE